MSIEELETTEDQVPEGGPTEPEPESAPDSEPSEDAAAPGPPAREPEPKPDPTAEIGARIAQTEQAMLQRLANFERQLSRMESRLDKGGGDSAAVRETRKQLEGLGQIRESIARLEEVRESMARLDGLEELRETAARQEELDDLQELLALLLRRTLEPEEFAALDKRRLEKRAATAAKRAETKAATERRKLEERLSKAEAALEKARQAPAKTASAPPPPEPEPEPPKSKAEPPLDPEVREAAESLDETIRGDGYDPDDDEFRRRLLSLVPRLNELPTPGRRLAALSRAFVRIKAEDRAKAPTKPPEAKPEQEAAGRQEAAKKETEQRRQQARGAVQVDRSRAGGVPKTFGTIAELEAAFARDQITAAEFRQHAAALR